MTISNTDQRVNQKKYGENFERAFGEYKKTGVGKRVYTMGDLTRPKRRYIYMNRPHTFGIRCDKCSGTNTDWSEFAGMIWCYDCRIDTRGDGGVFSGPIPEEASKILGMNFNRYDLVEEKVIKFNTPEWDASFPDEGSVTSKDGVKNDCRSTKI